jgi:hypothetical protein
MPAPIVYLLLEQAEAIAGRGADDLLGAIVSYLTGDSAITAGFGIGFGSQGFGEGGFASVQVFTDQAPKSALYPFLLIEEYTEVLPGETLNDLPVHLQVSVYTSDLDDARRLGALVKSALDSPAINPASTRTTSFTWLGGSELGVMRNPSKPYRMPGIAKRGQGYAWCETIEYEFWVSPTSY